VRAAALLERLITLTEQQLEAARKLDGARVGELAVRRADLLFELQVAMGDTPPRSLQERAQVLVDLEERVNRVLELVVGTLRPISDGPEVPIYGPSGQLRER
jgi:hypothetical protein